MSLVENSVRPAFRNVLANLGLGRREEARVPDDMRVYAVGDIHGCEATLARLHWAIIDDARGFKGEKVVVYLGDYVDRGPDSKGVVERLLKASLVGFRARFVRGNHDQAVLDFLNDSATYRQWRNYGAPETLLSYGVTPPLFDSLEKFEEARKAFAAAIPAEHVAFLDQLELSVVYGGYAFVHAGIRPGVRIERQQEQDLLWIRDDFLGSTARHDKVVVHGHSPVPSPHRLHNRIAVDTGTYATGVLSCAVLEGAACRFLQTQ